MRKIPTWDGKSKGSALGNLIFIKVISIFGSIPAYILLFFVSWYYVFFDKKSVFALKKYRLRVGFSSTCIRDLHRHFFSLGMALIDRFVFLLNRKQIFSFSLTHEDYLLNSLKKGKGAIILSGHIGNWEIAGNYLYDVFKLKINVVMVDNELESIKKVFKNAMSNRRFKTIILEENGIDCIIRIKKALQNNEVVCFHGDRVIGSSGVKLQFLGKSAYFPDGPFHISAITHTPIIPFFLVKEGFNHYCTKVFKPIVIQDTSKERRNREINMAMESYVKILENMVKNYPYQWFNFYNYWNEVN